MSVQEQSQPNPHLRLLTLEMGSVQSSPMWQFSLRMGGGWSWWRGPTVLAEDQREFTLMASKFVPCFTPEGDKSGF